MHAGRRVEDDALGPRLVVRRARDRVLEEVRERAVADVVEERGGEGVARALGRDLLPEREVAVDRAEAREEQLHHERGADGVREARVLGAGEGERRHAELADAAQALHLGRVDEARDDALLLRLERDEAVHRVAQDHVDARLADVVLVATRRRRAQTRTPIERRRRLDARPRASRGRDRLRAGHALGMPRRVEGAAALGAASTAHASGSRGCDERRPLALRRCAAWTSTAASPRATGAAPPPLDANERPRRARSRARAVAMRERPRVAEDRSGRPSACAASPVVPLPGEEVHDEAARASSRTR